MPLASMRSVPSRYRMTRAAVLFCAGLFVGCAPGGVPSPPKVVDASAEAATLIVTSSSSSASGPTVPSRTTGLAELRRDGRMANLQECILRHWVHSHEEDAQDVRVYRPAGYNFPPSRGRVGFEFRDGGELVYFGIARADGPEASSGQWTVERTDRVRIEVDNERIQPFILEIISCDDEML